MVSSICPPNSVSIDQPVYRGTRLCRVLQSLVVHVTSFVLVAPFCTAFVLGTPHNVHRFVANSQNVKLWLNDLRKLIFEQKKAFSEVSSNIFFSPLAIQTLGNPRLCGLFLCPQLLTHLTLPDEVYYTMKAKVALPYLASGTDGKSTACLLVQSCDLDH